MKGIETEIDKILDRYLDGSLTKDEVRYMHERLTKGENVDILEQELDKIHLPLDVIDPPHYSQEKIEVIEASPTYTYQKSATHKPTKHWLAAFMMSIIVLISSFFYVWIPYNGNDQQLFKEYFTPFNIAGIKQEFDNTDLIEKWKDAKQAYESAKYEQALASFKDIINSSASLHPNDVNYFYMGNCYLANSSPQQAIQCLEKVQEETTEAWVDKAQWYIALAHLNAGNRAAAKDKLKNIQNKETAFNCEKAQMILENM